MKEPGGEPEVYSVSEAAVEEVESRMAIKPGGGSRQRVHMRYPKRRGQAIVISARFLLTLGLLIIAAYGSSATTSQTSPTSQASSTSGAQGAFSPGQKTNFQVSTPNGQVSLSLNGQLPPNWPTEFPLPSGANVAGSGSLAGSSSGVKVAAYTTSASASETFSYYQSSQAGLTTSSAKSVGVGNSYVGRLKMTAPYNGSVTVVNHNGSTNIVVVLTS